ncbi:LacI family DNA-binding transcriptional regulator [Flagellimonas pacifica]|uniref:Regulatory protein, lacI family n=1 Tax=Flagellimonas pacifica TaxID=1247520 RepID=A0A285MQR9_9FLAO|nr:LacI family DNA-binding transcriptional regulator [Allomuricauda parva]SNY99515.1 regulatory protein, lacI family [Allomuricauda parva]
MVNLKQIAELSGYSTSTVSKALNDNADISKKTKIKIKRLAKFYNYIPNQQAIALRGQKFDTIAVMFPRHKLPKYSGLIEGIENSLTKSSYRLVVRQYDFFKLPNSKLFRSIVGYSDGMIILGLEGNHEMAGKQRVLLGHTHIPWVIFEDDQKGYLKIEDARKRGAKLLLELIGLIKNST